MCSVNNDYVFLDVETTGGNATRNRVTEVAAIHIKNNKVVKKWSCLINPEQPIPHNITLFTGISNSMVSNAPLFSEIAAELFEILEGKILVAHNARFDYSFLKNEFKRAGFTYSSKVLCSLKLSRHLFPEYKKHSLDSIIERFNLHCSARHRAMGDTEVLLDFWKTINAQFSQEKLETYLKQLLKKPSLPHTISNKDIDTIPDSPGVYFFYGKQDSLLYIGKSINLRQRVLSHFSEDHKRYKSMKVNQHLKRIDHEVTAGELEALLKESRYVKDLMPIFNKKLRRYKKLYTFILLKDDDGYKYPCLHSEDELAEYSWSEMYGLFRTPKRAKKILEELQNKYQFCLKRLEGKGKNQAPCFHFQLQKCKGACTQAETSESHNIQLENILKNLKITKWPFSGPIGIREKNFISEKTSIHLIENWCYLGSFYSEEDIREVLSNSFRENIFDLDIYRILKKYFKKSKNLDIIVF